MKYINYQLAGQFRRMAVEITGDRALPAVVCVHGLLRNRHSFDRLTQQLADRFCVISPDLAGRGESEWLDSPALYQPMSYIAALTHLLAWLDRPVHWLGTSLGGICGMLIAAAPGNPIQKLVLNDVGPFIPAAALARIASYAVPPGRFADLAEVEEYSRRTLAAFAPMSDQDWHDLARHSVRALPDGGLALHYDPQIAAAFSAEPQDVDLWPVYRAITCPRMVIRGGKSELLSAGLLAELAELGARTLTVPEAGHTPSLNDSATCEAIADFLVLPVA